MIAFGGAPPVPPLKSLCDEEFNLPISVPPTQLKAVRKALLTSLVELV